MRHERALLSDPYAVAANGFGDGQASRLLFSFAPTIGRNITLPHEIGEAVFDQNSGLAITVFPSSPSHPYAPFIRDVPANGPLLDAAPALRINLDRYSAD